MRRIWEWIRGVKRCPYCNKVCQNSDPKGNGPICADCFQPVQWFFPDWPTHRINVFDVTIQTMVTKEVPLTPGQYIKRLQLARDEAVANLGKSDRRLVEVSAGVDARLHAIESTWREQNGRLSTQLEEKRVQRDADAKLIESLEKAIAEHLESIRSRDQQISDMTAREETRLQLVEALRGELQQAREDRDLIGGEAKMMNATIARLRKGDFTPQELQDLCHGLDDNKYKAFADGCAEYQRKVFGKCDRDELQAKIAEYKRIEVLWHQAIAAIDRIKPLLPARPIDKINEGTGLTVEVDGQQITNLLGFPSGKLVDPMNSNQK